MTCGNGGRYVVAAVKVEGEQLTTNSVAKYSRRMRLSITTGRQGCWICVMLETWRRDRVEWGLGGVMEEVERGAGATSSRYW